jgi:hypothetical protein
MRARQILLIILFASSSAFSQSTTYLVPDSTGQVTVQPNLQLLPTWTPSATVVAASKPDSLVPPVLSELSPSRPQAWLPRWFGLGLMAAGSALSYYYHEQAEEAYQEYLISGNPQEMDHLFSRTEQLDRLSGWCFAGAEAGLVLFSLSVIISP